MSSGACELKLIKNQLWKSNRSSAMSIEVQNVSKNFGDFNALKDISLNFPAGKLTALLGPSGCGKTTLLRIIAGLERPNSGQVLLDGENVSDIHVRERRVGFVFQHYALFKHMTVFDNVAFGMRVKSRKQRLPEAAISQKVYELLDLVQMRWLQDRFPSQLSGGQRQRIALARALAVEPRVLLLDEPFASLDAKVRKELRRWLRNLHENLNITSIFVTHDQEEALEVADQVVLMNLGKVEQAGSPSEVYAKPASPFVYSFLGNINLFHGRIDGNNIRVGKQNLASHSESELRHGTEVLAFARPHELTIAKYTDQGEGISAIIDRILTFGAISRIDLSSNDNHDKSINQQHYEVEIPYAQMLQENLEAGMKVRLIPAKLRIFEQTQDKP